MPAKPYWPMYSGDWMRDPKLSACEPATRGIFVDWLCGMYDGQTEKLTGTARQLGRLGRCSDAECIHALQDLQKTDAAIVSEREGVWTIISRRRRRELALSETRSRSGSKGLAKRWQNAESENEDESDSEITTDVIYAEYPRKVGKPAALLEIDKAFRNGFGRKFLLDRTKAYAAAVAGSEMQFIPHPSTWFHQERFNDDPQTWKGGSNGALQRPASAGRPANRNVGTANESPVSDYSRVGKVVS